MQLPFSLSSTSNCIAMYDEIYSQSWQDTITQCERTLERPDLERALRVKSRQDFREELGKLLINYPDEPSKKAILLIHPHLDHYEVFARNFVDMMENPVDTSMMWGLLSLVFNLALGSSGPISPLRQITTWLERIGLELKHSNECRNKITDLEGVKSDVVEVNKEVVILWLNIIMMFRNEGVGHESWLGRSSWNTLTTKFNAALKNIAEAVHRMEKVVEMAEKHAQNMNQWSILQSHLSLSHLQLETVTSPCHTLPVAENRQFFGRQEILRQLEDHLKPADTNARLSSIALYGLGGVGKTQVALAYAYQKIDHLDAIFWISAESPYSIQQSFSRAALDALRLPKAKPQAYQENMVLVLNWLQKTPAKWLVIFDNVDNHAVLEDCWPISQHGAILVTSRDIVVATLPIDTGLEVDEFEIDEGAKFLLHMTPKRRPIDNTIEKAAAHAVSNELGGLPLALNQMAALINTRNYTIGEFHAMYIKHKQNLHKQKKSGWKYLGYQHALDTVWEISFTNLGEHARACLGVLSFFSADSVPLGDAIEELTHHALVRKNIEHGSFRIHRLVQAEYRARMENPQEEFEAAIKLLLDKLPSQDSSKFDDKEWLLYKRYIPQVLALLKNYDDSQTDPNPLKPTMDFVRLLTNSSYALHDNDTMDVIPKLLETADSAYHKCRGEEQDRLLWALLQYLKCIHHFCTSEFARSEREMTECLKIRLELLHHDDTLIALSYSGLGMAVGAQGRYEEGLDWLQKAHKVYEGPAGKNLPKRIVWGYNISRNYYCMGRYAESESCLTKALEIANGLQSCGHLTFASLRTKMNELADAKQHVDAAKEILEVSGNSASLSWLSSYCAYRSGDVAMKQRRFTAAIQETEKATVIGKRVKIPTGILARCVHAYSKALATDPSRLDESETQRLEARRLRSTLPDGGGDLDDEGDEAFERLVKMDHR
ncbi:uncharacterized protein GGS22DRAFT_185531 [Annulohypoxylon maeteangense]|uniref:uncharacterized protein n=1 Tax=Annulohypoxylon maeteangense TaxID=1927788 RepID=UPI0020083108|nr:uncharacterized protein GGS22DRAFT_185531 [Annulohypoxylon maeteangense]KAI0888151.1 hypothetical protein GGS22DRAFT_185531 [Annulohypoxylon maeteangense]